MAGEYSASRTCEANYRLSIARNRSGLPWLMNVRELDDDAQYPTSILGELGRVLVLLASMTNTIGSKSYHTQGGL
jgi:hypothetical protein